MIEKPDTNILGFLTVLEIESIGFCGGLLVLNSLGRPLEFHCTVPVVPTIAQQILYGATFKSFVFNEKIAISLINKSSQQPRNIVTDIPLMLELGNLVDANVCFVIADEEKANDETANDTATDDEMLQPDSMEMPGRIRQSRLEVGEQSIFVLEDHADHCEDLLACLIPFAIRLPLTEPFQRIKNAIEEAQSVAA